MKFAIVTRSVPPVNCGIGDYTIKFAEAARALGAEVHVFAGRGTEGPSVTILEDRWDAIGFTALLRRLAAANISHVLLQFTPLTFGPEQTSGHMLYEFWKECARRWTTVLIVHETYFRAWWYPPSWTRGWAEKLLLQNLVARSHYVFTASDPLVREITSWRTGATISLLPIGSNFERVTVDRVSARERQRAAADQFRLVLFGGGNSLKWMRSHVQRTDSLLHDAGVRGCWVLLGGIPSRWFQLKLPVEAPGRLNEHQISVELSTADLFLMPHYAGVSSKRGTLMAAMQHSLPVIGTESEMTDPIWRASPGVVLVKRTDARRFADRVLGLCLASAQQRDEMGRANAEHFNVHCTWPTIARSFLRSLGA
jgi:glycosyltransferase involved in cell wall biosynthesis